MSQKPFDVIRPDLAGACLPDFDAQRVLRASHQDDAPHFKPEPGLLVAINAALAVGAPLLLTGDPGTGKTQVAYWVARQLGFSANDEAEETGRFFKLYVQSTTTAEALLYEFDNVAYFHAAYEQKLGGQTTIDKRPFVRPGVLWRAFRAPGRSVALIDEIDKAPRDFPNDLLHALEKHEFTVRELPPGHADRKIRLRDPKQPPLVIITKNNERDLPEPFLRRCIFHELTFDKDRVRDIVEARARPDGPYPGLDEGARTAAIAHFLKLRGKGLRKAPSVAELLVWLTILSAQGRTAGDLGPERAPGQLPALGALVKHPEDLAALLKKA
jgi:MoxR-like ATPase